MKKNILTRSLLIIGFFLLYISGSSQVLNEGTTFKIGRTFGLIDAFYVDTADHGKAHRKSNC
jgi:hypothetical protein